MVDRPELQTLLEVSVSIGRSAATGDLDLILRRTLPLLVRRSASAAGAIVRADGDHLETLAVTPRSLRDRPEWATILRHLLAARGSDDAWVVRSGGLVHHGVALTGYGLLVLSRRRALPADFLQALLPVLEVLAAVLRAQRDRERSRTAAAKLRALDTRQRALLDALPFATWLTDEQGRYLDVNTAFLARVGRTRDEVLGRRAEQVLPAPEGQADAQATRRVLSSGKAERSEWQDPDSGRVHEIDRSVYTDERSSARGVIGFRRDVTRRVQTLRTLRWQAEFQAVLVEVGIDLINFRVEDLGAGIEQALARVGRLIGADHAFVATRDRKSVV